MMENFRKIRKMMEIYALYTVLRIYYKDQTYSLLINRSKKLVKFEGIQVHRNRIVASLGTMAKTEFEEFSFDKVESFYLESMHDEKTFAEELWTSHEITYLVNNLSYQYKAIAEMESKVWFKMTDVFGKKTLLSYYPNRFELILMGKPGEVDHFESTANKIRAKYLEICALMESRSFSQMETPTTQTQDEMSTVLTSLTAKESLTWNDVATYFKTRHDMFASLFQTVNGLEMSATDVKMSKFFKEDLERDMPEFLSKTPDMIYQEAANHFKIIEFAVTDSLPVLRIQDKLDKYLTAVNYLNSEAGKRVDFEIYVLDMNTMTVLSEPPVTSMIKPDCTNLKEIHELVRVKKNFEKHRRMMEMGLDDSKLEDLDRLMLEMIRLIERPSLRNIKAATLVDSRRNNSSFTTSTNMEDSYCVEIMSRSTALTTTAVANKFLTNYIEGTSYKEMFCPEVVKMTESSTEVGIKEVRSDILNLIRETESLRETTKDKIPTLFKLPWISKRNKACLNPRLLKQPTFLADGTLLYEISTELKEDKTTGWQEAKDTSGIGTSEEDISLVDGLLEFLREGSDMGEENYYDRLRSARFWECLDMWEEVAREIALMSERRFATSKSAGHFALKKFEHFWVEVHKGTKITKEKQLRFRIHISGETMEEVQKNDNQFFKSFKEGLSDCWSTDWLAISLMDLEHFQTISSRVKVIMKHMSENIVADSIMNNAMMASSDVPRFFMVPLLIMMEHKRNTSTSAQTARYVMHNVTSLLSDTKGVVSEIVSVPIRTRLQSFVVRSQLAWMLDMLSKEKMSLAHFARMASDRTYFDRIHMPSMYDLSSTVEFSVMMDEIYYSNIFNQKMGFRSHREKAIWEKQAKEERNYRSLSLAEMSERPIDDFLKMKDTHHIYSSETVRLAVKNWFAKKENKSAVLRANLEAEAETVEEIVKMTKSVIAAPTKFNSFIKFSREVEKVTVLEAVVMEMEKAQNSFLADFCAQDEEVYAIFSTFAKDQFGGAREILVQAIKTRIHTAYLNRFFKKLCEFHEKEMITDEKKKAEKQSSTCVLIKDLFVRSVSSETDHINVPMVINADASKWAPSMVMEYFIEMLSEMSVDTVLFNHMVTIFRSYSAKLLFLPESLKMKWQKRPSNIPETSEDLEWVRSNVDLETGMMIFFSGMGQGNFQHPSSFFHCLIDDLMDEVLEKVLQSIDVRVLVSVSLISSDDSTKMLSLRIPTMNWSATLAKTLLVVADIFTTIRKAANIHINWKKTALQSLIVEFNSMFSIGKRVALAVIKSLYNSQNVVDMTYPERAVKEVISHCRPLLEEGASIPTVTLALKEMRSKLIKWYNLAPRTAELSAILNCSEEELPAPLGFVPIQNVVETLIYGAEYNYIAVDMSEEMTDFFKGLYSAKMNTVKEADLKIDVEEMVSTKYMIKLNTKLDKKVQEFKKKIIRDKEKLKDVMERWAMMEVKNTALLQELDLYLQERALNIKVQYEFSESFRMNSMIRAMQLASSEFETNLGDEGPKFTSVIDFTRFMILRKNKKTSFNMLDKLKETKLEIRVEMEKFKKMKAVAKTMHDKYRTVAFFNVTAESYASEAEIIKCIMSSRFHTKIRVFKAVTEITRVLRMDMQGLFENPFKKIKEAFPASDTPFTDFRNFINCYVKMFFRNTMKVVCDFLPEVSKASNILSLYKTKSKPGFQYELNEAATSSDKVKMMDNLMLVLPLDEVKKPLRSLFTKRERDITPGVSRKEWAMKVICNLDTKNCLKAWKFSLFREMFSYNRDTDERVFWDKNALILINVLKESSQSSVMITVRAHKNRENHFEVSSSLKGLVEKEINTYMLKPSSTSYILKLTSETIHTRLRDVWSRVSVSRSVPAWDVNLKVTKLKKADSWALRAKIQGPGSLATMVPIKIYDEQYKYHASLEIDIKDNERFRNITNTLEDMMLANSTLKEVIAFIKEMEFFKSDKDFTSKTREVTTEISRRVNLATMSQSLMTAFNNIEAEVTNLAEVVRGSTNSEEDFEMLVDTSVFDDKGMSDFFSQIIKAVHNREFEDDPDEVEDEGYLPDNIVVTSLVTNALWNSFNKEMEYHPTLLTDYDKDRPYANVRMAFTNVLENVSEYVGYKIPHDVALTLLILMTRKGTLIFKEFPYSAVEDVSSFATYQRRKKEYPRPKEVSLSSEEEEELNMLDRF